MPVFELSERRGGHPARGSVDPSAPPTTSAPGAQPERSGGTREQQWVIQMMDELDGYRCRLKQLNSIPPDEVYHVLSAVTARLAEIRATTWRSESRRFAALRSHEIDPLIEECDRQFKYHSRVQSVAEMEWKQMGRTV